MSTESLIDLRRYDEAVILAARRAEIEAELIKALFAHRRRGLRYADAAKLSYGDFSQPDLAMIYASLDGLRDEPRHRVLIGARGMLRRKYMWDDQTPAGSTSMRHSDRTLAHLATRNYCVGMVPVLIGSLRSVQRRQQVMGKGVAA